MLSRRKFVSMSSILLASNSWKAFANESRPIDGGWMNSPVARLQWENNQWRPRTSQHTQHLAGSGEGKVVLLWKALELGSKHRYIPHRQRGNDCVGHAAALGVDVLSGIQAMYGQADWRGKHSTETIYAGSRIDIAIEKHDWRLARFWSDHLHTINFGGGSTVVWAAEWLQDYGALVRAQYGAYDLRKYNYRLTHKWRNSGVPEDMEVLSKSHPVRIATRIDGGWNQAVDLIANGFPIIVGSPFGFNNSFDREGFLRQNQDWAHAMLLWGIDTKSRRQGGCFANSKGANWARGPVHKYGTPPGAFWADAKDINTMLNNGGSYAISNFRGYPRRDINDYLLG